MVGASENMNSSSDEGKWASKVAVAEKGVIVSPKDASRVSTNPESVGWVP